MLARKTRHADKWEDKRLGRACRAALSFWDGEDESQPKTVLVAAWPHNEEGNQSALAKSHVPHETTVDMHTRRIVLKIIGQSVHPTDNSGDVGESEVLKVY